MYAIIADGSHQYKVEEGQLFEVQRKDLEDGAKSITFDRVLLVAGDGETKVGHPTIDGAKVTASVVREVKGHKLVIQKLRRRKNSRLKKGHRQKYLQVKVEKIEA